MDYGRYFRLDADASDTEAGITVFRYRPDGRTDSPVYAAFTDHGVEFYAVGQVTNGQVLRIPLDENFEGDIGAILSKSFRLTLRISEMREYVASPMETGDPGGYFAAFFNSGKGIKPSDTTHPWNLWKTDKTSLPLAKLALDFLYDLRETRVFEMSPRYVEMTEKLRENFFFRALAAKSGYYYYRTQRIIATKANARKHPGGDARARRIAGRRFYDGLFFDAEKEWTDCIRNPNSDATFHNSGGWFDTSERELRRVYRPWVCLRLDAVKTQLKNDNDKLSSRWLTGRYAVSYVWSVWPFHWSFFGTHLFLPRVVLNIFFAWFTFVIANGMTHFSKTFERGTVHSWLVVAMLVMMFGCSYVFIRRMAPLVRSRNIFTRSVQLTAATLLISLLIGGGMWLVISMITVPSLDRSVILDYFSFLWIASAYMGTVIQLFLNDKNPSESI